MFCVVYIMQYIAAQCCVVQYAFLITVSFSIKSSLCIVEWVISKPYFLLAPYCVVYHSEFRLWSRIWISSKFLIYSEVSREEAAFSKHNGDRFWLHQFIKCIAVISDFLSSEDWLLNTYLNMSWEDLAKSWFGWYTIRQIRRAEGCSK